MTTAAGERRLSELILTEAPLPAPRALALMVAVSRQVLSTAPAATPHRLTATEVRLHADGSVTFDPEPAPDPTESAQQDDEIGAAIGRLLFELMVGRAPLDRSEAFEPVIRAALPASVCSLLARSFSDAPGQWPTLDEWAVELEAAAGGQAPPIPAPERRALRRRSVLLVAALVALIAATVLVLVLAPGWWDAATDDDAAPLSASVPRRNTAALRPADAH